MSGMGDEPLIIVPARGGSRRLPGKNLRSLAGRSLLERVQDAVAGSRLAGPCVLSTDDSVIARAGEALGWRVPFLRPARLARDDTPTLPVVMHLLDWYAAENGGDPALVMLLQPTSPLRQGADVDRALDLLGAHPRANAVLGVRRLHVAAEHVYTASAGGVLARLAPEAAGETAYVPNGAIYLVRTATLRATRSFTPAPTLPLVMDDAQSVDIDTETDWAVAQALLQHRDKITQRDTDT